MMLLFFVGYFCFFSLELVGVELGFLRHSCSWDQNSVILNALEDVNSIVNLFSENMKLTKIVI